MVGKYTSHLKDTDKELSFFKEKQRLRMLHKQLRVGLVQWDDISDDDRMLLQKYYGWSIDGGWGVR